MTDKIAGYAIQWNQPAIIGGLFEERFAPGAFDRSLVEHPDVVALWSHDSSRPLARVANGTMSLRADRAGLYFAITPNKDSPMGQEAIATVGAGTVDEVSIGFVSEVEEWDDRGEIPRRTITQARLIEISLVVWGAYGKGTSAKLLQRADNQAAALRRIKQKAERAQRERGLI